jgi:hypothetical protein
VLNEVKNGVFFVHYIQILPLRRKTLIAEIRRLAAAIKDPPDEGAYNTVVLQLEDERKGAGASLSKVIDTLKRV